MQQLGKILILGGTGFVGQNVNAVLTEAALTPEVTGLSRGVDLRDSAQAADYLARVKPAVIINCAARVGSLNFVTEHAADVIVDNSRMIVSLYEAIAKSCPKALVINPIANCAYPNHDKDFVEDNWWDGHLHPSVLAYGATRRHLWAVGRAFEMQHGIRSISLLVPNMYGPHDSTDPNKTHALNALIAKFVVASHTTRKVQVWGSGIAIREWLYAADFGRIVNEYIANQRKYPINEPINIAQNFGLSVRELVDLIASRFDVEFEISYDSSRPDGAPRKVMDDRKFRKVFPEFQFTTLEAGITETVKFYQSIYPYPA